MIENKNSQEKFAKSDKLIAPKTQKNWDSVHSWSASPGLFMPVKSWDLPKNASVNLHPITQLETLPTVSPLKGHYIQRYEYFFCPYRNYLVNLVNDNVNELDKVENMKFPLLGNDLSKVTFDSYVNINNMLNIVSQGHLFRYLGYPSLAQFYGKLNYDSNSVLNSLAFTIGDGPLMLASDFDSNLDTLVNILSEFSGGYTTSVYSDILESSEDSQWFVKSVYGYTYNAVPLLAYIDIFMNFVANPSENYVYNICTDSYDFGTGKAITSLLSTPFSVMQSVVPAVRRTGYTSLHDIPNNDGVLSTYDLNYRKTLPSLSDIDDSAYLFNGFWIRSITSSGQQQTFNPFLSPIFARNNSTLVTQLDPTKVVAVQNAVNNLNYYNHEGMFLVPYLPDYFSTWLDPDDIQFTRSIVSSDLSVQSLRLAERKWADFGRQLVNRSKRYTSWLEIAFGLNGPKLTMDTKPIWVGRDDVMINFHNIESNAETDKTTYTGSLGSNVSKAEFRTDYGDVQPIRFTTQEPGLLMCVSYIVPEVSYGKGVDKFLLKRKMGDLYRVPYDAIGFQTTDSRELDAGCSNPGTNIGYVISWLEYMTKVNTHVGLFCTTPFKSWILSRETTGSATIPRPDIGEDDPWYLQNSTYIDPDMFNHSFVNIGQGTDNFLIQTLFNFECKLPMSNQILNTRW